MTTVARGVALMMTAVPGVALMTTGVLVEAWMTLGARDVGPMMTGAPGEEMMTEVEGEAWTMCHVEVVMILKHGNPWADLVSLGVSMVLISEIDDF